jgi:hypothetical protein
MTIIAVYKSELVEVLDVWTAGGRKVAEIKALDGQTWQAWTMGGWAESDTRTVPAALLHPVEECTCTPNWVTACGACRLTNAISREEVLA